MDSNKWESLFNEFKQEKSTALNELYQTACDPMRHRLSAIVESVLGKPKSSGRDNVRWGNHSAFSVTNSTGLYYDFSTQEGGNIVKFVKDYVLQTDSTEAALATLEPELTDEYAYKYCGKDAFARWAYETHGVMTKHYREMNGITENSERMAWDKALSLTPEQVELAKQWRESTLNNPVQEYHARPFSYDFILRERNQTETFAYLTQVRGLDENLIVELMKNDMLMTYFKQGENDNGSTYLTDKRFGFPMHNCNGDVVGMDTRQLYTKPDGSVFRGLEEGTDRRNGFVEFPCGDCDENAKLLIFEATIDALSYLEMYRESLDNCRLVVTAGVNLEGTKNVMQGYHVPPENVIICTDNDRAGNELYDHAVRELGVPPENRQVPPDGKKDWNAYLCQVKGISEELKKNPDTVLRQAFFQSVTSGKQDILKDFHAEKSYFHTVQEMPSVSQETVQKVVNISAETLTRFQQKIDDFQQRIDILQQLQNPDFREHLEQQYADAMLRKRNGERLYLDNQTRRQFNTLYLLNEAEQNGNSAEQMITVIQRDVFALQNKINECGYQQEEISQIQQQKNNVVQKSAQQEMAG